MGESDINRRPLLRAKAGFRQQGRTERRLLALHLSPTLGHGLGLAGLLRLSVGAGFQCIVGIRLQDNGLKSPPLQGRALVEDSTGIHAASHKAQVQPVRAISVVLGYTDARCVAHAHFRLIVIILALLPPLFFPCPPAPASRRGCLLPGLFCSLNMPEHSALKLSGNEQQRQLG